MILLPCGESTRKCHHVPSSNLDSFTGSCKELPHSAGISSVLILRECNDNLVAGAVSPKNAQFQSPDKVGSWTGDQKIVHNRPQRADLDTGNAVLAATLIWSWKFQVIWRDCCGSFGMVCQSSPQNLIVEICPVGPAPCRDRGQLKEN